MKTIFPKHQIAQEFYKKCAQKADVIESGVDSTNKIYFHKANGNVIRHTKKQFISKAMQDHNNRMNGYYEY